MSPHAGLAAMRGHPLEVATCIACGARSRLAECPDGCDDVPVDLVEAAALEPPDAGVEIIQAWGCPACGRVDAPQPCLGVCVRRPVAMVGVRWLHELTAALAAARADDARLSALARLVAGVTPREGQAERTHVALRDRARGALDATGS